MLLSHCTMSQAMMSTMQRCCVMVQHSSPQNFHLMVWCLSLQGLPLICYPIKWLSHGKMYTSMMLPCHEATCPGNISHCDKCHQHIPPNDAQCIPLLFLLLSHVVSIDQSSSALWLQQLHHWCYCLHCIDCNSNGIPKRKSAWYPSRKSHFKSNQNANSLELIIPYFLFSINLKDLYHEMM